MLKGILFAASAAALAVTGTFAMSAATSTTAEAQQGRGFGCITNASRCNNQLTTPRTFASDRRQGAAKGKAKRKGKRR